MGADTEYVTRRRNRLREWIDAVFGGRQADFVQKTGVNQGELSGLLRQKSFGEKRARSLEILAGMPLGYLDATDTPGAPADSPGRLLSQSHQILRSEIPPGYLRFQVMGIGGAGPGMINSEEPEVLEEVDLAEWQVRKEIGHIVSPDRVKLLTVRGSSMLPKIRHGDVVFVDIEDRAPMDGGIFVVLIHGHALVKRIDIRRDGYHVVGLASPERADVYAPEDEADIGIAGRVLGAIQLRKTEDI